MTLTIGEIITLYWFAVSKCPDAELFEITQSGSSGIGTATYVQVKDKPETITNITDYSVW